MGKKRKQEAKRLDEADRTIYSTFRTAANSLSLMYTQAMAQQKAAFQSGERNSLEKLYQLISRNNEQGLRVTVAEIVAYLQKEIDYRAEDAPTSLSSQLPHQYPQSTMQSTNLSVPNSSLIRTVAVVHAPRTDSFDQTKDTFFSNALSSPVRQSLEPYHLAQHVANLDSAPSQTMAIRNHAPNLNDENQDIHSLAFNDSLMDMH